MGLVKTGEGDGAFPELPLLASRFQRWLGALDTADAEERESVRRERLVTTQRRVQKIALDNASRDGAMRVLIYGLSLAGPPIYRSVAKQVNGYLRQLECQIQLPVGEDLEFLERPSRDEILFEAERLAHKTPVMQNDEIAHADAQPVADLNTAVGRKLLTDVLYNAVAQHRELATVTSVLDAYLAATLVGIPLGAGQLGERARFARVLERLEFRLQQQTGEFEPPTGGQPASLFSDFPITKFVMDTRLLHSGLRNATSAEKHASVGEAVFRAYEQTNRALATLRADETIADALELWLQDLESEHVARRGYRDKLREGRRELLALEGAVLGLEAEDLTNGRRSNVQQEDVARALRIFTHAAMIRVFVECKQSQWAREIAAAGVNPASALYDRGENSLWSLVHDLDSGGQIVGACSLFPEWRPVLSALGHCLPTVPKPADQSLFWFAGQLASRDQVALLAENIDKGLRIALDELWQYVDSSEERSAPVVKFLHEAAAENANLREIFASAVHLPELSSRSAATMRSIAQGDAATHDGIEMTVRDHAIAEVTTNIQGLREHLRTAVGFGDVHQLRLLQGVTEQLCDDIRIDLPKSEQEFFADLATVVTHSDSLPARMLAVALMQSVDEAQELQEAIAGTSLAPYVAVHALECEPDDPSTFLRLYRASRQASEPQSAQLLRYLSENGELEQLVSKTLAQRVGAPLVPDAADEGVLSLPPSPREARVSPERPASSLDLSLLASGGDRSQIDALPDLVQRDGFLFLGP